jgi:hypothetical protein
VRIEASLRLRLTRDDFLVAGAIEAAEKGVSVFRKDWDRRVPRRMV